MKRIQSACLLQTIAFRPKDDAMPFNEAKKAVRKEFDSYLTRLDRSHTAYRITEQTEEADGSIVIRIMRQYNSYPTDSYLD